MRTSQCQAQSAAKVKNSSPTKRVSARVCAGCSGVYFASTRTRPGDAIDWVATGDVGFTIRWRADVTPLHRVVYDGRTYDVMTVADDGRREALLVVGRARTETRDEVPRN